MSLKVIHRFGNSLLRTYVLKLFTFLYVLIRELFGYNTIFFLMLEGTAPYAGLLLNLNLQSFHLKGLITGIQFVANKQFSMEKRLGTSVCADNSKHPLKNQ